MASNSQSIAKESTLLLKLKERLALFIPSATISVQYDASGASLLVSFGSSHQAMAVKILKIASDFTDSVGNSQAIWAPLKCQVLEEAAAADANASIVDVKYASFVNNEVSRMSLLQERWILPNGTAPALSQLNSDGTVGGSASLATTIRPDIQWPLSGQ